MEAFSRYWPFVRGIHRPVTRSVDVFFELRVNKRLSKLSGSRWYEAPSRSLWRHCNAMVQYHIFLYSKIWEFPHQRFCWPDLPYPTTSWLPDVNLRYTRLIKWIPLRSMIMYLWKNKVTVVCRCADKYLCTLWQFPKPGLLFGCALNATAKARCSLWFFNDIICVIFFVVNLDLMALMIHWYQPD